MKIKMKMSLNAINVFDNCPAVGIYEIKEH